MIIQKPYGRWLKEILDMKKTYDNNKNIMKISYIYITFMIFMYSFLFEIRNKYLTKNDWITYEFGNLAKKDLKHGSKNKF